MNTDQTDDIDEIVSAHRRDIHRAPEYRVQQWHDTIDRAAALERGREYRSRNGWHPGSFFWGAAVTAVLAVGIAIGFFAGNNGDRGEIPAPAGIPPGAVAGPASLTRSLQFHLLDSKKQLASLNSQSDNTLLILQLIEQNRLFETVAERNDAPELARVLRAFEPILLRLASGDIAPEDAAALRTQLSFELNVMLTKLVAESSEEAHST